MRVSKSKTEAEIVQFESMKEMTEYIDPSCFRAGDESFVGEKGLHSWDNVTERTLKDWQEGMEVITMYKDKLQGMNLPELKPRQRFTTFRENEGDEFDPERAMQGMPAWRVTKREKRDGPATITIVIDTTAECYRDSLDLFWRGAGALALADLLEKKGYGTEIWVVNGSKAFAYEQFPLVTCCNLKRPGDVFDISTLTNAVAGWMYRTVTFALIRTVGKKTNRLIEYSLGAAYTPTNPDLNVVTSDEIRVYSAGYFSFNGALSALENEIERISKAEETGEQPK